MQNVYFLIDFDSTFIRCEALDKLAEFALANNPKKLFLLEKIKMITCAGMEGKITFHQSLRKRLAIIKPKKKDLFRLTVFLKTEVSKSINKNKLFFIQNQHHIYIISGGFKEYIWPVIKSFGIKKNHLLANQFILNKKGEICDYDKKNPLTKTGGKVIAVKLLNLKNNVYIIGDGYTDYQVKQAGLAKKFIAYCENVKRKKVAALADLTVQSFDEVIKFFLSSCRK